MAQARNLAGNPARRPETPVPARHSPGTLVVASSASKKTKASIAPGTASAGAPTAKAAAYAKPGNRAKGIGKRGFEVSIGFLVILIFTVIIFAGSIYFLFQFGQATSEIQGEIDRDTEAQLLTLMQDGSIVAVPFNKARLNIGKGKSFGVGIQNVEGAADNYGLAVAFSTAFDQNEDPLALSSSPPDGSFINDNWVVYVEGPHRIDNNDYKAIPVYIQPDREMAQGSATVPGTYVFNVCVYDFDDMSPASAESSCGFITTGSDLSAWYTKKVYKIFIEVP